MPPSEEELAAWRGLDPGSRLLADGGARPADAQAAEDFYLRAWAEPSVEVNGIAGGEAVLADLPWPDGAAGKAQRRGP